ncbi:probable tyrosyl-DNA phosphodiesterase isoform X2 [Ostrinia furnacalis]|uniref:probable tyrosyl-DNA phosphodiesterase isoform X2 n=1 Tax=Ostrinia furnacalis TaxID=93504 RepID=UPI00103EC080|nr:probable tyrosyl-DNA phosphodiesterase isoform X2 [Ostrinia furnacalis]
MSVPSKRTTARTERISPKRPKKECSYKENCFRRNPTHFMEYCHPHLESILDEYDGCGRFNIPDHYSNQRGMMMEQLQIMLDKKTYEPGNKAVSSSSTMLPSLPTQTAGPSTSRVASPQPGPSAQPGPSSQPGPSAQPGPSCLSNGHRQPIPSSMTQNMNQAGPIMPSPAKFDASPYYHQYIGPQYNYSLPGPNNNNNSPSGLAMPGPSAYNRPENHTSPMVTSSATTTSNVNVQMSANATLRPAKRLTDEEYAMTIDNSTYRPMVAPARSADEFLKVVRPRGKMADKHAASAPYHIFYTAITDAKETHDQPYSITFLELLDYSLGELKASLQINFMVEPGWLLAQYYFAGFSAKRLTILYGDESTGNDIRSLRDKKPHIDTHYVSMPTPYGKHHTKLMLLCYEDGSIRVVVSTANLYIDDWENRTQGLWFSPSCPELPEAAMPHDGESPTMFKKALLRYLNHYHLASLAYYVDRVKRCDFSHINVFLVASAPGSHFDVDWGMTRVGSLLRQHCAVPAAENDKWPLLAQASSIGSFGKEPKLWLTGDFLHQFTKIKNQPQALSPQPELKLIYPSLENVRQSHDDLLGGGCLPYAASAHQKQLWLNSFLYQWKATHTHRNKAMPHIKSYTRTSPDNKRAAYYILTSGNVSKAAWGSINKGNAALRVMSYEAGVLFLPKFVINEDFFPLEPGAKNRLIIPYDIPPTKYTSDMSPWVSDYLR